MGILYNNAMGAYQRTGFYSFQPHPDMLEEVIKKLRYGRLLGRSVQKDKQWEVKVITADEGRPNLTAEEKDKLVMNGSLKTKKRIFLLQTGISS